MKNLLKLNNLNAGGHQNMDTNQELEMLREFYFAWVALHSMPKENRHDMEFAARRLVEAGHVVANFRKSQEKVVQNG